MKAFVIKNKEGKYWQLFYNNETEFVDELYNAFMHYSREDAEKDIDLWELNDCEVVEITIAEGDLEQQLAEKDKEIERLKYQLLYSQVQVPKEEIEKFNNVMLAQAISYEKSQIRKQVCDGIRDYLNENFIKINRENNKQKIEILFDNEDLMAFIDETEKGRIK